MTTEIGTVGWEGVDEYHFLGSDDNDGHTLVRVQLYRGRDHSKPLNPDIAQGHQILCHLNGLAFQRVPPRGTRVYVAFPEGMEHVDAAGVIFATVEKNRGTQLAADRAVLDFGPDVHVIIKGKSITLQDPAFRFVAVGSPRSGGTAGVQIHLPDGTGSVWQSNAIGMFVRADSLIQMSESSIEMWQNGGTGAVLKMGSGAFITYAATNKVQGAACYIGKAPTPANTALWGISGPAAAPSPSVFISPV